MSLDELISALPDHARDLRLNFASVIGRSPLTTLQLWGTVLACAIAVRSPVVLRALAPEARSRLSPEAYDAVRTTASAMALSNVFFRTRHLLSDPEYGTLRPGLRTTLPACPGVDRTDVELWSVAVSAVNGCGACLDAHERVLRDADVDREVVQEAFKIASVIQAVATTLETEAVLAPWL
ncbi:alkyl hydroperoxide reductase [Streptomyces sp. 150FB]|uniref:carboxymuconolactone decarboxylase family protein n=1 Tax=Streptomyces sp. 150FB TaxID=1576605 RepID=UPI0005896DB0|nr:carboxymuconolactone decarboxylase family protein [Streptomyces sp. 150FB]KIF76474.1 alkyl hydroperoxide reductase [Streptomyces sp. 150FB]